MRKIGRQVSKKELDDRDNWISGRLIDFGNRRFIRTDELYTPKDSTTLDWENLGDLGRRFGGNVIFPGIGAFEDLLTHLIEPLRKKGEFCCDSYREGFYYLLKTYYGGIHAYGGRESDPHGRSCPTERTYYPRRLADAQGYIKHIARAYGFPALMGARVELD